ncbi:MAG: 50S ribosomal protein L9, partial [Actinomycetota bacterium]|nr:50S ribosomal protein L9 [Actinomycetota bacterium]
ENGKLFGSITRAQIAEQLAEKGIEIDRRKIELKDPIKQVGDYEITIKVRRELHAKIDLTVTGVAGAAPEVEAEVEEEEPANLGSAAADETGDEATAGDEVDAEETEEDDEES